MDKVIKMCLIHDLGEAVTGDVPAFYKTEAHRRTEDKAVETLLAGLPAPHREEFAALFAEMEARETEEAKLWKALDNLEAVISHNEAALSTWIPLEYTENLVYGESNCAFSPWTAALREMLKQDSIEKIEREQ
jgi:putative hydrolase of HD superfamily